MESDYSSLSLKRRFLVLSVSLDYRNRESPLISNASRMPCGHALSSSLRLSIIAALFTASNPAGRTAEPCFSFEPSVLANRGTPRAAKMCFSSKYVKIKAFQRAARTRDERDKCGWIGSRFAFLDLRRFAVSLAIYADQFNHLYFRQEAE